MNTNVHKKQESACPPTTIAKHHADCSLLLLSKQMIKTLGIIVVLIKIMTPVVTVKFLECPRIRRMVMGIKKSEEVLGQKERKNQIR